MSNSCHLTGFALACLGEAFGDYVKVEIVVKGIEVFGTIDAVIDHISMFVDIEHQK